MTLESLKNAVCDTSSVTTKTHYSCGLRSVGDTVTLELPYSANARRRAHAPVALRGILLSQCHASAESAQTCGLQRDTNSIPTVKTEILVSHG